MQCKRVDRIFERLPRVAWIDDLFIGQGEVWRSCSGDHRAAIEWKRDRAQDGDEVDGRAAIKEHTRRRKDIRHAFAIEDVEVVVDDGHPPEENGETSVITLA